MIVHQRTTNQAETLQLPRGDRCVTQSYGTAVLLTYSGLCTVNQNLRTGIRLLALISSSSQQSVTPALHQQLPNKELREHASCRAQEEYLSYPALVRTNTGFFLNSLRKNLNIKSLNISSTISCRSAIVTIVVMPGKLKLICKAYI